MTTAAWPPAVSPTPTPTTPGVASSPSTWKALAAMALSRPGGSNGAWAQAGETAASASVKIAASAPRRKIERFITLSPLAVPCVRSTLRFETITQVACTEQFIND